MRPVDYTSELLCLGIDIIICGVVYRFYRNSRNNAIAVREAPSYEITSGLKETVSSLAEHSMPYVAVKGHVEAFRNPLKSQNLTEVTGVVQQLVLKEHKKKWTWATRWWSDTEKEIHNVTNSVPFVLKNRDAAIEVVDALKADIIDLSTIHDKYEPTNQGFKDMVLGFIQGEQSKGFQHIERMLTEGTVITGIGELVWRHGCLQLQAPNNGKLFYLTQMSQSSLVKKLDSESRMFKVFVGVFGAVGMFILFMILKKYYKAYKEEKERRQLEELRQERRQRERTRTPANAGGGDEDDYDDSRNELRCVVCLSNPREVLIKNCNHVCCCADCIGELVPQNCPICRNPISSVCPVFIS